MSQVVQKSEPQQHRRRSSNLSEFLTVMFSFTYRGGCVYRVWGAERALRFTFMGPQTKRQVATWTRNSSAESTDGLWAGRIANSTTTPIFTGTLGLVFGENQNIWLSRVMGFVICFICCFINGLNLH